MKIWDFAIRRPIFTVMVILVVLVLGAVSLLRLTIDLFPEMKLPMAAVVTTYSGAGPQEVETLVTRPLEEVMGTVNNVKEIKSESSEGVSVLIVDFNWGTDMDLATLQMREKIDIAQRYLPDDADKPAVFKMDPAMMPIIALSVSGGRNLRELRGLAEDVVKGRLERLDGVASVGVAGGYQREINVLVDPARLQAYGVSLAQLTQALQVENMNLPGGRVEEAGKELLIRTTGEFHEVSEIEEVLVPLPQGGAVKVKDLARVEDSHRDLRQHTRMNGRPSVGLFVQKQTTANTVKVAGLVKRAIPEILQELPPGVDIRVVMDQSGFINNSIKSVVRNATAGGILAVLILYVFLRNFRSTLVIATAIPISIIATFVLIYFAGLTLNIMSLGGLALGVGMLVDNAIVVLENIFRHRQEGLGRVEAAGFGTEEVASAVTASTLTTMVVFLPIIFVEGIAAQFFRELALTVSFSLFASLLVALSLLPMLSSRMLRVEGAEVLLGGEGLSRRFPGRVLAWLGRAFDWLNTSYRFLLRGALARRRLVVAVAAGAFITSLFAVPLVGMEFVPRMDTGEFSVEIKLPDGAVLADTEKVVSRVEALVNEIPERESVFTTVGAITSMTRGNETGSELGKVEVKLVPRRRRSRSVTRVVEEVRDKVSRIPGAEFKVNAASGFVGGDWAGAPITIILKGDDLEVLRRLAQEVANRVRQVPGTRDVDYSLAQGQPEVQVRVNRDKAAAYGLGLAQVASTVRTAISGQVATRYRVGGDEIDVRVRLQPESRQDLRDLENLVFASPLGVQVPLREVADLVVARGPVTISREGQSRIVTVTGGLVGRSLGAAVRDVQRSLADLKLPPGYAIEYGGENKEMMEAFASLGLALVLAVFLVYMIMAAQFESLLYPLVIMFSVPLAFVGVIWGLALTRRSLNVPSFMGVIMLVGIVVNNAIVLVDYINTLRRRGFERNEAIIKAGPTRLRPILMTTLTTVLAMLPLALGLGESGEAQAPMATVVIGGLTLSTLLTLVVVPVVYTIFDDLGQRGLFVRLASLRLRWRRPSPAAVAAGNPGAGPVAGGAGSGANPGGSFPAGGTVNDPSRRV